MVFYQNAIKNHHLFKIGTAIETHSRHVLYKSVHLSVNEMQNALLKSMFSLLNKVRVLCVGVCVHTWHSFRRKYGSSASYNKVRACVCGWVRAGHSFRRKYGSNASYNKVERGENVIKGSMIYFVNNLSKKT